MLTSALFANDINAMNVIAYPFLCQKDLASKDVPADRNDFPFQTGLFLTQALPSVLQVRNS
jgi:hypothetical protein